ncbi:MAG: translocation/assembly module TamB domain-containing protein [Nitrospirota bacterium]
MELFGKSKKRRWGISAGLILFLVAVLFFLLRGPYLSNSIKRVIIPVLENATGERIIIDNAVINLFPFYLQAKGFKVFDKDGNRLLWITKARAYIDMIGLVAGEARIRRLTLKEPDLTADSADINRVTDNIRRYLSSGKEGNFKLNLNNVKVTEGKFLLNDSTEKYTGNGLFADIVFKKRTLADFSLKEVRLQSQDISRDLKGEMSVKAAIDDNKMVELLKLNVKSSDSMLEADGKVLFSPDGRVAGGRLNGKARLSVETLGNYFDLKPEKGGELAFTGSVDLLSREGAKWPLFRLDLETDNWFYLETLMNILEISENVKGKLFVKGKIQGIYPELTGDGKAKLEDAVFDRLPIDAAAGKISYSKKKFSLSEFTAHTYDGEMQGSAHILIPHGDYYVSADVSNVLSPKFFEFIGWDAPFPSGRISGDFKLNKIRGEDVDVTAGVSYINKTAPGEGPLNSLERIKGKIDFRHKVVVIKDAVFLTAQSKLNMNGDVDTKNSTLDLATLLESGDASEITAPSLKQLRSPARFTGRVRGPFSDPEISGSIEAGPGSINGMRFTHAAGDLSYRIASLSSNALKIKDGQATYNVAGAILFKEAKELFSFDKPYYKAVIKMSNGSAKDMVEFFYSKEMPLSGKVDGEITLEGTQDRLAGKADLLIKEGVIYGQQFDKITATALLDSKNINFQSVTAFNADSIVNAKGAIYADERFTLSLSSDNFNSDDITILHGYPAKAFLKGSLEGSGTIKNPRFNFRFDINDVALKNVHVGSGEISGEVNNKELTAAGSFLNGLITAKGTARFADRILWNADVNFKKGAYNSVLAAFLGEKPEDVSAVLEGTIKIKGRDKEVSLRSIFNYAYFDLYGYKLTNKGDIALELEGERLNIKSFLMAGDVANLSASGDIGIGRDFNVKVKGNLSAAPLKAVIRKVKAIRGEAEFDLKFSGRWEAPEIAGQVSVKDATASMSEFPYKIGPINGSLQFTNDRFTFQSLRAELSGGIAELSGAGYFERFSLKRLFVTSLLRGVRLNFEDGVSAVFDGNLFYETDRDNSTLAGDIYVSRAKYKKRFEWKNWLLGLKEVKQNVLARTVFRSGTRLNIRVSGAENILIDNNIARTPVKADINVVGTLARYGLLGSIETKEGSIFFRGNEFDIIDGRMDFIDPNDITPVFHIQAETFTAGYRIKLDLDGTVDKFTLALSSDPHLSEMDLLTLLTSGQINLKEKGFESGIAAGEAASILTGTLQDTIEEKFRLATGLERFEINPQTTVTGAVSPRITVGKRLLEDKLMVIYSTSIGTTEENIVKLEYLLEKNFSLVGSRDETGSIGMDLKLRFEFK